MRRRIPAPNEARDFQILPVFLNDLVSHDLVVMRYPGGPVILLFWLYVMANIFVFGAEVNWWVAQRRLAKAFAPPEPAAASADEAKGAELEPAQAHGQPADTEPLPSKRR